MAAEEVHSSAFTKQTWDQVWNSLESDQMQGIKMGALTGWEKQVEASIRIAKEG